MKPRAQLPAGRSLRGVNLESVLTIAIDRNSPFTRADVVEVTGLSAPTVGSLVSQLIQSDLLVDLGSGPSSGGRRPSHMEFNARHGFVVGIDLGPTKTRLAIADLRGERLAQRVVPTPSAVDPGELLSRLGIEVQGLLRDTNVSRGRLLAVGAGAPGAVDHKRGVVSLAPNLTGWSDVPMGARLERALGAPVVVENDVNLAILGEHWRGAARGHATCAFITLGTGIGAGIVVDHALHRGHHFLAGEIAHMCMGPQFVEQDFGSRGCLETLAGLKALTSRWPHLAQRDPDQWVSELFEAAKRGDPQARQAVDEAAKLIGIAAANLILVLDPSLVVLGGALAHHGEPLVREVRRIVGRVAPGPSEVVVSTLCEEAPLWGCLLIAINQAQEALRERLRVEVSEGAP